MFFATTSFLSCVQTHTHVQPVAFHLVKDVFCYTMVFNFFMGNFVFVLRFYF